MSTNEKIESKNGPKVTIASVSYLNSIPFIYGIEQSGAIDAELRVAPPVECTSLLKSGEVDIALVPVAAIPNLGDDFTIITSLCIGASGPVRTVVLVSDEPLHQIETIWLDPHSQSSVKLLAHLCDNHFNISPKWKILSDISQVEHPNDGDAFLLIGDKVFDHEGVFEYSIDLAYEWQKYAQLPFVFAAWCARKEIPEEHIEALEEALTWGVEHTFEALQALRPDIDMEDGYRYLTENIDPLLDGEKRAAMAQFWESKSTITLHRED